MKRKGLCLLLAVALLLPATAFAAPETTYTEKQFQKLWDSADLVVEGVVETITQKNKGYVVILGVHKDVYGDEPSLLKQLNEIPLPEAAAWLDEVTIFLKRDKKGNYAPAVRDKKSSYVVHRPEDRAFISALIPGYQPYAAQYASMRRNQAEVYELGYVDAIQAYFEEYENAYGGLYFDDEGCLQVVLTMQGDYRKARREIEEMTEGSELVCIRVESRRPVHQMLRWRDELVEKYDALSVAQKEQLNAISWGYNEITGKVEIEITDLDKEKRALFRRWVSNSSAIELVYTEHDGYYF